MFQYMSLKFIILIIKNRKRKKYLEVILEIKTHEQFQQRTNNTSFTTSQSRKSSQLSSREQYVYYNKNRFNPNQQFYVCKSRPKTQPKYRMNTKLPIYVVEQQSKRINNNKHYYEQNSNISVNLGLTALQSIKRYGQRRDQKVRQEIDLCLYTAIDRLKELNTNQIDYKKTKITNSQARTNKILNQRKDKSIHRIQPELLNKYIQTVYKQYQIDNPFEKTENQQGRDLKIMHKNKQGLDRKIKYLKQEKQQKRTTIINRKRQQKKFLNVTLSKEKSIKAKQICSPRGYNKITDIQQTYKIKGEQSPLQKKQKTHLQLQRKKDLLSKSSKKIKQLKDNISNNQEEIQNMNLYEKSPYQLLNVTDRYNAQSYKQQRTRAFQETSIQVRSLFLTKQGEVQPQFRFCLLCQQPILSINIEKHERNCIGYSANKDHCVITTFVHLYRMTDKELRQFLAMRIKQIRQRIQSRIKKIENIEINFKNYSQEVCRKIVNSVKNYLDGTDKSDQLNQKKVLESYSQIVQTANNQYFKILDEVAKLHWFIKIYDNYSESRSKFFCVGTSNKVQSIYQKVNNDSTKDRRFFQSIKASVGEDKSVSDFKIRQSLIENNMN